ncbi:MAG TPA: hypothetical protein EYH05_21055 [Anaerolineae bacterium]|nr:hypothetical protein [Anaerolineae bacterium]
MNSNKLLIGVAVLAGLFFIVGGALVYLGNNRDDGSTEAATAVADASAQETAVAQEIATGIAATIAAAATDIPLIPTETAVILPTNTVNSGPPATPTPLATALPTNTPIPTDTPIPTNTAIPPTAVPIVPTNTPIPPPTATPVPAGPQPGNQNGLIATYFGLQPGRSEFRPNGKIWYEWTVENTTGGDVRYSAIGVMPRRNGKDENQWFQINYGGGNATMPPEGLSWPSWLSVPETGNYTLRLVVCFDQFEACRDGLGTYHTLSNEVPITINP